MCLSYAFSTEFFLCGLPVDSTAYSVSFTPTVWLADPLVIVNILIPPLE